MSEKQIPQDIQDALEIIDETVAAYTELDYITGDITAEEFTKLIDNAGPDFEPWILTPEERAAATRFLRADRDMPNLRDESLADLPEFSASN